MPAFDLNSFQFPGRLRENQVQENIGLTVIMSVLMNACKGSWCLNFQGSERNTSNTWLLWNRKVHADFYQYASTCPAQSKHFSRFVCCGISCLEHQLRTLQHELFLPAWQYKQLEANKNSEIRRYLDHLLYTADSCIDVRPFNSFLYIQLNVGL